MRWRALPFLVGPVLVAEFVFLSSARVKSWSVTDATDFCTHTINVTYLDYLLAPARTAGWSQPGYLRDSGERAREATELLWARTTLAFVLSIPACYVAHRCCRKLLDYVDNLWGESGRSLPRPDSGPRVAARSAVVVSCCVLSGYVVYRYGIIP